MDYFAHAALLPEGWRSNVLIRTSARGDISEILVDSAGAGARRLGGTLLPGVPNLHSHAHQRAMAGLSERAGPAGDSFWTWRDVMYRFVDRLQPEDLHAIAAEAYLEMLERGYTAVAEFHYLHLDESGQRYASIAEMSGQLERAARDTGIGITHLPVLYRYAGFGEAAPTYAQRRFISELDDFLELYAAVRKLCRGNVNARVGVAPHSLRAVSEDLLVKLVQAVKVLDPGAPVHLHIAEQAKEVDECFAHYQRRPVEWLLEHCAVDGTWCLVHSTHVDPSELAGIVRAEAVVGICPTTEANLGDGVFPAVDYLARGGAFGIGSDSNVSVCPAAELRLLEYGQRLTHHKRNVLARGPNRSTGKDLFAGALAGGAQALGRSIGRLEVGTRADFITLDTEHPALSARSGDALLDSWIFGTDARLVEDVVVGGAHVIQGGEHAKAKDIRDNFKRTLTRLLACS